MGERLHRRPGRLLAREWALAARRSAQQTGTALQPATQAAGGFRSSPGTANWSGTSSSTTTKQLPHHDVARLPNGNVLLIVWEIKTAEETIAAGRSPESVDGPWLVDSLVEIRPTGKTTGEVVWEWHLWDHLIQDQDKSKANFGKWPLIPN